MTTLSNTEVKMFEETARHQLRKSPALWIVESLRLSAYVFGRVIFVPWCLIWPAVTVWFIWWVDDVGARAAIEIFATGPARSYAWLYVVGATFHSLAIVGSDPYEWEIDRRLRAKVLHFSARGRWVKKERDPSVQQCVAPKGWERVEAGTEAA